MHHPHDAPRPNTPRSTMDTVGSELDADTTAVVVDPDTVPWYKKHSSLIFGAIPMVAGAREKSIPMREALWKVSLSILFVVACGETMAIGGDAVSWWRMPRYTNVNERYEGTSPNALNDVGFDWISFHCPMESPHNLQSLMILLLYLYYLLRVIVHRDGVQILSRFTHLIGVMYLLRLLVIPWTSLPNPNPACWRAEKTNLSYLSALKETLNSFPPRACGTLVYSGHAGNLTVLFLLGIKYPSLWFARPLLLIPTAMALTGYYSIIACRSHYTVDVVIGILIPCLMTELCFLYFPTIPWMARWEMIPHRRIEYVDVTDDNTNNSRYHSSVLKPDSNPEESNA